MPKLASTDLVKVLHSASSTVIADMLWDLFFALGLINDGIDKLSDEGLLLQADLGYRFLLPNTISVNFRRSTLGPGGSHERKNRNPDVATRNRCETSIEATYSHH